MRSDFLEGARQIVPVMLSTVPFAMLFGAVAAGNGLSVGEASLMSLTMYAGASQLVGIELFGHHVPAWLIILSVFAVNFRHILYSAAIGPFVSRFTLPQQAAAFFLLTDPQFALTLTRNETGKPVTFAWYMGLGLPLYVSWNALTTVGALFGQMIGDPNTWGINVLLPIYFMGLLLGFRKRSNFLLITVASALSSVLAHVYIGSPWHVSIGAVVGIALAAALPPKAAEVSK
jgi:Predicted branched-chain amino acid permease (azaleucine resistance)